MAKSRAEIQRNYRRRLHDKQQSAIFGTDRKSAVFYDLNTHRVVRQSTEDFTKENQPAIMPLKPEVVSKDPDPDNVLTYEKWLLLLDLIDAEKLAPDEWSTYRCRSCSRINSILQTYCHDCSIEMDTEARQHQEMFLIKRPHLVQWRDWKDRDSLLLIRMNHRSRLDNDN